jgi:alkylation response protein AidB-like acyl-CoA dehydrogenase
MSNLNQFQGIEGTNFFEQDRGFRVLLEDLLPREDRERVFSSLHQFARLVSGRWDQLASEGSRPESLPRIVKYDRVGNRVERVDFGATTRQLRREVADFGILTRTESDLHKFALTYYLGHNGEASVMCGLSCTDGAIRALQAQGSESLKNTYLPRLLSVETPLAGAQFITEQAGGSDVGAIESRAEQNSDGSWSIVGEKWFCSNPDEYFVVAARPSAAPAGTDGLALFLVPRTLDNGRPNRLSFRRLKDKLGTRSLPTAEIDFEGATGFAIGDPSDGFKTLMNHVINTSRIHNAVSACGFLHRAFLEARNYAKQREAFGHTLIESPIIQETLVTLLERLWRNRVLTFRLIAAVDQYGLVPVDAGQAMWQRFLLNLAKYRTAVTLADSIREAMLILGGNGIVEDFTVLPRLLRDALILETWEGPPNTLCLQIMRDAGRSDLFGRWHSELSSALERWPTSFLSLTRKRVERTVRHMVELAPEHRLNDRRWAQAHARRLVDRLGDILELAWMAEMASRHVDDDATGALLTSFAGYRLLPDENPFEHPILDVLPQTASSLIAEETIRFDVGQV